MTSSQASLMLGMLSMVLMNQCERDGLRCMWGIIGVFYFADAIYTSQIVQVFIKGLTGN